MLSLRVIMTSLAEDYLLLLMIFLKRTADAAEKNQDSDESVPKRVRVRQESLHSSTVRPRSSSRSKSMSSPANGELANRAARLPAGAVDTLV